jgi:hypothetical protein
MERLYNRYAMANDLGNEISDKIATFINGLLEEYSNVDLNDLKGIVDDTVGAEMAVARMIHSTKLRKAEKTK